MSRRLHIEKGNLVTREILFAYLNNELNDAEKLRLEKQMADDEFLRDAVEGLRGADLVTVNAALDKLYTDIDIITGVKRPVAITPRMRMYAVAAMLIVFLGATFLIMDRLNQQQTNTTQIAMEDKTEAAKESVADSATMDSDMGGGSLGADTAPSIPETRSSVVSASETIIAYEDRSEIAAVKAIVLADEISVEDIAKSEDANFSIPDYEEIAKVEETTTLQNGLDAPFTTTNVASANESLGYAQYDKDVVVSGEMKGDMELAEITVIDKRSNNTGVSKAGKWDDRDDSKFKKSKGKKELEAAPVTEADDELYKSDSVTGGTYVEEIIPQFPGGKDSLGVYFARNIKNPNPLSGISGDVYVKFLVNENGTISEAQVMKGLGPSYDIEALRVVANMPAWIPGSRNGVAVKAYYTIIITF